MSVVECCGVGGGGGGVLFFLMIRRPPRSTQSRSSAASDVYKRQIPESADAPKVLDRFRKDKIDCCVVVNEYGTLEGIITLHDILENLIGEIPADDEQHEPDIYVRDDKSYLISGDAPAEILDGVFDNYIIDHEHVEYVTVAGFFLDHIEIIPPFGD